MNADGSAIEGGPQLVDADAGCRCDPDGDDGHAAVAWPVRLAAEHRDGAWHCHDQLRACGGQFVWGAVQPVAGALADRYGTGRVLAGSLVLLAIGCALTPLLTSAFGLMLTMGFLFAAGAGGAGFSVLIGGAAQHVPANKRGTASGVINAGGSFGQFVFAPLAQKLISVFGWAGAMWSLAVLTSGCVAADPHVASIARSNCGAQRRLRPTADSGAQWAVRLRIAVICCCTRDFLRAAFTSHFW